MLYIGEYNNIAYIEMVGQRSENMQTTCSHSSTKSKLKIL